MGSFGEELGDGFEMSMDAKCKPAAGKNEVNASRHELCMLYNELSARTIISGRSIKTSTGGGVDDVTMHRWWARWHDGDGECDACAEGFDGENRRQVRRCLFICILRRWRKIRLVV